MMVMNIKGAKAELIQHVTFPSYVQASIILQKHDDINRTSRKNDSLDAMEALSFKDVQQWAIDSVVAFQELRDSGVTIEDFGLRCLIKSLDGKSKFVQHSIVNDINSAEDLSEIEIFDLVQRYASDLASVDGIKKSTNHVDDGEKVNALADMACHNCGIKGHLKKDCTKPPKDKVNEPSAFRFKCTKCNKKGHKRKDCPEKDKPDVSGDSKSKEAYSSADLVKMMETLKSGGKVGSVAELSCQEMADTFSLDSCDDSPLTEQEIVDGLDECNSSFDNMVSRISRVNAIVCDDDSSNSEHDATLTQTMGPRPLVDLGDSHTDLQGLSSVRASASLVSTMEELMTAYEVGRSEMCTLANDGGEAANTWLLASQLYVVANLMMSCDASWKQGVELHNATALSILESEYYPDGSERSAKNEVEVQPFYITTPDCYIVDRDDLEMWILYNSDVLCWNDGSKTHAIYEHEPKYVTKCIGVTTSVLTIPSTVRAISAVSQDDQSTVGDGTWVSLCGGMDTLALVAKQLKIMPSRFASVETSPACRKISDVVNPKTTDFPGIDHTWAHDLLSVTKDAVADLGVVTFVGMGAPCQDHSKCRLLPARHASDMKEVKRPGFAGPKGKVFKHGVQVIKWMIEANPKLVFLVENVDFTDMKDDFNWVCSELGVQPVLLNGSFTTRNRLYWTNLVLPSDIANSVPHGDPNTCMDVGRTLQLYKGNVRTICSSWTGDPNNPTANTRLPVLVDDVKDGDGQPQQLRPHEAELLMGMPKDCTQGDGITAIMRLRCIGNAWDVNVVSLMVCVYRITSDLKPKEADLLEKDRLLQRSLVMMQSAMGDEGFASVLAQCSKDDQVRFLTLLTKWHRDNPAKHVNSVSGSILDSGSGRHINNGVTVTNDDACPLRGFNNTVSWTSGSGTLPIVLKDQVTGSRVSMEIQQVDKVDSSTEPMLSLGKLLRQGVDFHFTESGSKCEATSPDGEMRFEVKLGKDDVLRIVHEVTNGDGLKPVTNGDSCNAVSRHNDKATAMWIHELLNHGSNEICYQTLLHTHGYKPVRMLNFYCSSCAQANARKKGLSHKSLVIAMIDDTDYVDYEPATDGDSDGGDVGEYLGDMDNSVVIQRETKQHKPRFDIANLKPYEVMMADNKDLPCEVRGSFGTTFLLIDVKSQQKFCVKLQRKAHNYKALTEIIALTGAHKLSYSCELCTDGCGSMSAVREVSQKMGILHTYVPPHMQSLNEAEKVVDRVFAAARTHMLHKQSPNILFADCVEYVVHVDQCMATTPSRGYLTPLELLSGEQPSMHHLVPWYTPCTVTAPKKKRDKMRQNGDVVSTGEQGHFIGYQSSNSKVYKVLLSGNRVVHSINVTFDFENSSPKVPMQCAPNSEEAKIDIDLQWSKQSEEAPSKEAYEDGIHDSDDSDDLPDVASESKSDDSDAEEALEDSGIQDASQRAKKTGAWKTHNQPLKPRPRNNASMNPKDLARRSVMRIVEDVVEDEHMIGAVKDMKLCAALLEAASKDDHELILEMAHSLAMNVSQNVSQKDMSWKKALSSDIREKVVAAFEKEYNSLVDTVLTHLDEDHPNWEIAIKEATTGRFLLDIKRDGTIKGRGVKRGFEENLAETDGPGFNYYAHVAEMKAARVVVLRPGRGSRQLALKDVTTAFLQSIKYPDGKVKYVKFKNPITGEWMFFEQCGPTYGENSAPVMWGEHTLAPWLEDESNCGFIRGCNHKCVYHNPTRDLTMLTYVDDFLFDGEEEDIHYADKKIDGRFDCKALEWLTIEHSIDYIGVQIIKTSDAIYMSMEKYIDKMVADLLQLGMTLNTRVVLVPLSEPIDADSELLDAKGIRLFLTGLGCMAWCSHTVRVDCSQAFSRLGQHSAKPTVSALKGLTHAVSYLYQHKNLCLTQKLFPEDLDLMPVFDINAPSKGFEFRLYADSDHAGNTEVQNKRRSQNGGVYMVGDAVFDWSSKASSVTFATELIGEAHADMSSGAVEVYAAGNATIDILDNMYLFEEAGMEFPKPFTLLVDNTTAEAFMNCTVKRSKLKHIDCRQEWCKMLRNKKIVLPEHVDTDNNLADLETKILGSEPFVRLRNQMMVPFSV